MLVERIYSINNIECPVNSLNKEYAIPLYPFKYNTPCIIAIKAQINGVYILTSLLNVSIRTRTGQWWVFWLTFFATLTSCIRWCIVGCFYTFVFDCRNCCFNLFDCLRIFSGFNVCFCCCKQIKQTLFCYFIHNISIFVST